MIDFNIDIDKDEAIGHDKLNVFCDTLNLTNLVKSDTCYTNNHKSTIDKQTSVLLGHQCN